MFVTLADFEHPLPTERRSPDAKHWEAMAISMDLPWFLAVTAIKIKNESFTQTTAFAWELGVLSLLKNLPAEAVLSLDYIAPCHRLHGGWTMSRISEVWLPAEVERAQTGPLLLRFSEKDGLYDCFDEVVGGARSGRKLLLRISDGGTGSTPR